MDNLEKELTELLRNENGFESSVDESTRKEMAQMISQKFESDMSNFTVQYHFRSLTLSGANKLCRL